MICLIRRKLVSATPEERIRQALLHQMLHSLSFPKGLVSVEKKIGAVNRRVDIIVYLKKESQLMPLLLIECKAGVADEESAFRQAVGYLASMAAPFWSLAHAGGVRTFWSEGGTLYSVPFLPPYQQLLREL